MNTAEDKLRWIFDLFDQDAGGSINAVEIQEMVHGLFKMAGVNYLPFNSTYINPKGFVNRSMLKMRMF